MNSETTVQRICRFGVYEADFQAGTLKRHGVPLRVQDQPFRILGILLERPGQVVSRDELRNRLWPEGTFVEFDGSLNTALMKLRAVLNDDSDNPRFVETVPKKGYRFIAPVESISVGTTAAGNGSVIAAAETGNQATLLAEDDETPAPSVEQIFAAPPKPRAISFSFGTMMAAALVLTAAVVLLWRSWPMPEPAVTKVTQMTHTGRVAPNSRVVTDGARVYFVSQDGGQWSLMTTSIRGGSVERLSSPFESTTIFDVSPDRTQLLIGPYAGERQQIPVWIWPAHGGVPQRLGDVQATEATWSPRGDLIAIAQSDRLLTVKPDGSDSREIHKFPAYPHSVVWSDDGSKIRFTLTNLERATDEMWEVRSDGTGMRMVLTQAGSELHDTTGVWSSATGYFLFTRGSDSHLSEVTDSISNLWVTRERTGIFSRASAVPREITHGPVSFHNLEATGESNSVFALGTHPAYQLVRVHSATGARDVVLPDAGATDVDVTPDGEWLVYSLRENGALWKSRRNGKERQELTASSPGAIAPQWSPDGKEVLFTAYFLSKRPQIYWVSSSGGTPRAILPDGATGSSTSGDWAPDGNHILFDYFENGKSSLRVLDRKAQKIDAIPGSEGLTQGRWSPDGNHVAAIDGDRNQIMLYSFGSQKWTILTEDANAQGMRWSADGNFVYFQKARDPEQSVYRIRVGSKQPEKVLGFATLLGSMASQCRFTGVAPDGSVYATLDRGGTDLYSLDLNLP